MVTKVGTKRESNSHSHKRNKKVHLIKDLLSKEHRKTGTLALWCYFLDIKSKQLSLRAAGARALPSCYQLAHAPDCTL
ncbi:unnamed protein product [Arctia plantaginis]|uniref:Uncharacterized protein n=1 Tax=Arctia plantaginis TaxID=874455 RepID=A0A8S1ADP6_ARCPL|nr:unnamed protein product [Arctia plantaginis]CAB3260600.1 unnamed protein product [Arctia plantaginis]